MKRIVRSAAVLGMVTLASVATAQAQGAGRASFHVAGGITLPSGDFGDGFNTGWQGLGGVSFGIGALPFAIRVDAFYGQNSGDEDALGVSDVKVKMFGGMAGGQFNFGSDASPVKPYILAQVGMVNSKVDVPNFDTESESDFAFGGGGGVGFGHGSMAAFVEGQYVSIQTEGSSSNYIVARFGIRFGGGM
jgi:hypothetical protein